MSDDPSHLDDTRRWRDAGDDRRDRDEGGADLEHLVPERPVFLHPSWTVGLVLVFAVVFLLLGTLGHPLWLLIGSPFILTLGVWLLVKWVEHRRAPSESVSGDGNDS